MDIQIDRRGVEHLHAGVGIDTGAAALEHVHRTRHAGQDGASVIIRGRKDHPFEHPLQRDRDAGEGAGISLLNAGIGCGSLLQG